MPLPSQSESYLFEGQQHELLCLGHLHEVLQDVLVGGLEQVAAGVRVGEAADAQAVGGVQLAQEELAAGVPHPVELQEAGGGEQRLQGGTAEDEEEEEEEEREKKGEKKWRDKKKEKKKMKENYKMKTKQKHQ